MRRALFIAFIAACALAHAALCAGEGESVNEYRFQIILLEDERALNVMQQVEYVNATGARLNYVMFAAYGNCFRREAALPYDNDTLVAAFPRGYAPGGLDIHGAFVNGERADWGVQGADECFIRVACELEPGESCTFAFSYTVLITENKAFLGAGDLDWRLTDFYLSVCPFEYGDFATNALTRAGRGLYAECADFSVSIALPARYDLACAAIPERADAGNGYYTHTFRVNNARDLGMSVSARFHTMEANAASGARVRAFGRDRGKLKIALDAALQAIDLCEAWFGEYPYEALALSQSESVKDGISSSGVMLIGEDAFKDADELRFRVCALVARQYFGGIVSPNPNLSAWLIEAPSEYAALLMIEQTRGENEFVKQLNARLLPALKLTIPGGLTVNSPTMYLASQADYDIIARDRGAAVMHELRVIMGREAILEALKLYIANNRFGLVTERDFANALAEATGRDWEGALIDYLNTIHQYADDAKYVYD